MIKVDKNEKFRNNKPDTSNSFSRTGLILMSVPAGEDVEVYKRNRMDFLGTELPYWVKFTLEPIKKEYVDLINNSITYLSPYLTTLKKSFSKKELNGLSGRDIRLVNMYIARKIENVRFFELNTAGLSLSSIKIMLKFLISEISDSNNEATYLVIEPDGNFDRNAPIFVTKNNFEETFRKIYE